MYQPHPKYCWESNEKGKQVPASGSLHSSIGKQEAMTNK